MYIPKVVSFPDLQSFKLQIGAWKLVIHWFAIKKNCNSGKDSRSKLASIFRPSHALLLFGCYCACEAQLLAKKYIFQNCLIHAYLRLLSGGFFWTRGILLVDPTLLSICQKLSPLRPFEIEHRHSDTSPLYENWCSATRSSHCLYIHLPFDRLIFKWHVHP